MSAADIRAWLLEKGLVTETDLQEMGNPLVHTVGDGVEFVLTSCTDQVDKCELGESPAAFRSKVQLA